MLGDRDTVVTALRAGADGYLLKDRTPEQMLSGSTMIIGQLAPADWHSFLGTNHMADAMMDRIVPRAHTIALKGDLRCKRL
jgi:DNA-binding NarL/FixJ family response regulator